MKKLFAIVAAMLLFSSVAFAANQNDQGTSGSQGIGHNTGNQGNDKPVGNAGGNGNGGGCDNGGPQCVQTDWDLSIANPYFHKSGGALGNPSGGGWGVTAYGNIQVYSYAEGTKSADTMALATGKAVGFGGASGISAPSYGVAASDAYGKVTLLGVGVGVGVDNRGTDPDFASVDIKYSGFVGQGNGIGINNTIGGGGGGTGAGGNNKSYVEFGGGSYVEDHGKWGTYDKGVTPAFAVNVDGASGFAGGYTTASYNTTPTFAAAEAETTSFSGHNGDYGRVWGFGDVGHGTFRKVDNAWGETSGAAEYCYDGSGTHGSGTAQTSGWTNISNTPTSNSVTSFSRSSSSAQVQ